MSKRASIFGDEEVKDLDLGGFAPKHAAEPNAPSLQKVKEVTEAANFRSREPAPPKHQPQTKRKPRVHRTGRNVQFNVKASQVTIDAFYAVAETNGWVYGYALQRAVEALQRELKKQP
jgi:hypothetical protein